MKRHPLYAALLALGLSGPAAAADITIAFGGSVDNDPYGTGWSSFTGLFTYDSAWSDVNPATHTGTYQDSGAGYGISVDFAGGSGYSLYGSMFSLSILNDYAGLGDAYLALGDDGAGTSIGLNLYDSLSALFGNDSLPTDAPLLGGFDWLTFALFSPDSEIGGVIDSLSCVSGCIAMNPGGEPGNGGGIDNGNGGNTSTSGGTGTGTVPEPASLWLLSVGFWASAYAGRRRDAAKMRAIISI